MGKKIFDVFFALHNRYVPALLFIAISVFAIFLAIHTFVNTITKDGDIINMSGKQRMLSQQILILTKTYVTSLKEEDYEILMQRIDEMKYAHSILHAHTPTEKLKKVYGNTLNNTLENYLKKIDYCIQNKNITDFSELRTRSQDLLKILDNAVEAYKEHYNKKVLKLKAVVGIFLIFVLIILLLTGRYVFYPASKKIKKSSDKLVDEVVALNEMINSYVIMSKTDSDGIITYVSDEFCRISGYDKEELLGKTHSIVRHPSVKKEVFVQFWSTISSGKPFRGIVLNQNKDGSDFWFESFVYPEFNDDGMIKAYVALRKDITDKKELEKLNETLEEKVLEKTNKLQKANKELSDLLDELTKEKQFIQDIIDLQNQFIIVYEQNKLLNANHSFLDFFGCRDIEEFNIKYSSISKIFINDEGFFKADEYDTDKGWIEYIYSHNKEEFIVLIQSYQKLQRVIFQINVNRFSDIQKYLITLTDITMLESERREYLHKASHDTLTGALNRSSFNEFLQAKILEARTTQAPLILSLIDIDHFKKVNDEHGHLVGDNVLKTLTKVFLKHIRSTDIFARWGGEEFALVIPNATKDNALHILEKLRYEIMNTTFDSVEKVTCSFGVTSYIYGDAINDMMQRADDALYQAKENGRNKVIFL